MILGKDSLPPDASNSPGPHQETATPTRAQMRKSENGLATRIIRLGVLVGAGLAVGGCGPRTPAHPEIALTRIPPADAGGPQKLGIIEGSVHGAEAGQQIVLYAHSRIWYVQPLSNQPLTKILPDGTWRNSTHLGTEYAALLVDSTYHPAPRIGNLPEIGNGVIAVAVARGTGTPPAQKTIHFSGYDWVVNAAGSDRGGEPNNNDPENVWVDENGLLHLRMGNRNGKWSGAEVSLARSLGYGNYKFAVRDTARLSPSAVVTLFTWDDIRSGDFRNELDIELSRWGDPKNKNAQYVVQPFYVPENISRFTVPAGPVTHTFRWEPEKVTFRSLQGASLDAGGNPIAEHVFTSGVPAPVNDRVHIDIYGFRHSTNLSQQPSEVVIEKFEYLP
jgi:hypothetical protein